MMTKKKTTKTKKSTDKKKLLKESEALFNHVTKELKRFSTEYDTKKMLGGKKAIGDGYFFVIAKSHSVKEDSDFTWGQSNFNYPSAAIVGVLDEVSQATVDQDLLNLFAQNLGKQFAEQYGEDFAQALTVHFYEFLEKVRNETANT